MNFRTFNDGVWSGRVGSRVKRLVPVPASASQYCGLCRQASVAYVHSEWDCSFSHTRICVLFAMREMRCVRNLSLVGCDFVTYARE